MSERMRVPVHNRSRPGGGRAWLETSYAAIDLGTNNCRLLIARRRGDGFRVADAYSRIVRLGEGVARTRLLGEEAMARTMGALHHVAAKMRRHEPVRLRGVATEACRRAANGRCFLARVKRETGLAIAIIDTEEEARLAMLGSAPLFAGEARRGLLFDIGGGSTQISWLALEHGKGERAPTPRFIDSTSLPHGVVTLAESAGRGALDSMQYAALCSQLAALLVPFDARNRIRETMAAERVAMVGTSGTVTTLAGVALGLRRYDRRRVDGVTLGFDRIRALNRMLSGMSRIERASLPCIGHERAEFVAVGCAVLEAICNMWPVGRLRVGDRGLREGILLQLMSGQGVGEGASDTPAMATPPSVDDEAPDAHNAHDSYGGGGPAFATRGRDAFGPE